MFAPRPYSESSARRTASAIPLTGMIGAIGPNVSDFMIDILWLTFVRTVGSKKYPFLRAGGRRPPHITRAPCDTASSILASICFRCASRRSEEHTSELQSHVNLVCRLLLEK